MQEIKHKDEVIAFDNMLTLMERVRKECPWDSAQTNDSLRTLTIEEVYELSEAILNANDKNIKEELADVMMHIVFYALIGKEKNSFTLVDVMNYLSDKLIRRHPHVFNKDREWTSEEVEHNWEKVKLKEGNRTTLSGVPDSLPSLIKAYRLQGKAAGIGFDWGNEKGALDKIKEELDELEEAITEYRQNYNKNFGAEEVSLHENKIMLYQNEVMKELGDVLFSIINYARKINVNPDTALEMTNRKFKSRFESMEKFARDMNKYLSNMNLEEMDDLWEKAKEEETKENLKR